MSTNPYIASGLSAKRYHMAEDFRAAMRGVLSDEQIDAAVHTMLTTTTTYPAKGNVVSMAFYLQFQVSVLAGQTFEGKGGGISPPGASALYGEIFTNDLELLYRHTAGMQFHVASSYATVNFFDRHSNLLGSFCSSSVSMVQGTGGGYGKWKQPGSSTRFS
ncbi:VapA/VapB family virulence-associated protein [Hymenobacter koreensis]|uniref:VapA/VapB family virulence-associated protein n=1 Tax=Hymenobacter koreensis TaxID=1084523 RepID=A0ABP8JH21_9BACT